MMTTVADNEQFSIDAMELGPMENFIYLITDKKTQRAAVVDPAWDVPEILKLAEQKGVTITDILLTHSHHDHINGIEYCYHADYCWLWRSSPQDNSRKGHWSFLYDCWVILHGHAFSSDW